MRVLNGAIKINNNNNYYFFNINTVYYFKLCMWYRDTIVKLYDLIYIIKIRLRLVIIVGGAHKVIK